MKLSRSYVRKFANVLKKLKKKCLTVVKFDILVHKSTPCVSDYKIWLSDALLSGF